MAYLNLLQTLQRDPNRVLWKKSEIKPEDFDPKTLPKALQYLHAVGDIVLLGDEMICVKPLYIAGLLSSFISPEEVQLKMPHLSSRHAEILTSDQVGKLLLVQGNNERYYRLTYWYLRVIIS